MIQGLDIADRNRSTTGQFLQQPDDGKLEGAPQWAPSVFLDSVIRSFVGMISGYALVAGMALPTRSYAALMIAAGIVLERGKNQNQRYCRKF